MCCSPWGCRVRHNLVTEQQQSPKYCMRHRNKICITSLHGLVMQNVPIFMDEESEAQRGEVTLGPHGECLACCGLTRSAWHWRKLALIRSKSRRALSII